MNVEIKDSWNDKLALLSQGQKDVYFSESYVKMAANGNEKPLCAICEDGDKILLLPFLRGEYKGYFDFETAYGYGGPITNSSNQDWIKQALNELSSYFSSHNYLVGFVRFHPLLNNSDFCRSVCTVIDDRKTVAIDTSVSDEEIWTKQISSKNRNMIRKAEKNGLVFERDDEFKHLDQFKRLYNTTMTRLDAEDFYFFDDNYYKRFVDIFKGKGFLGSIKKGDDVISAALFMFENEFGHYHLAGSNKEYSSSGANNLLLWKVACEMHKEGVREFHLGGGTNGDEENTLFKFKSSFSSNLKLFSIGKMIFNKPAYESVCAEWAANNPDKTEKYKNFLLKYRY